MNQSQSDTSGGPLAVQHVMRTRLHSDLTRAQARNLWDECRNQLLQRNLAETVAEIEASTGGRLDTVPREDLMSAFSLVLTGSDWPTKGMPQAEIDQFGQNMRQALHERGYARVSAPA